MSQILFSQHKFQEHETNKTFILKTVLFTKGDIIELVKKGKEKTEK